LSFKTSENRFHKRMVLFLIVKTIEYKRGRSIC